jgi:Cys-rich protein (TIGR01571 family)
MPQHYRLPVKYRDGGRTLTGYARIPQGGVLPNETFEADILDVRPVYGRWKKGEFDCGSSTDTGFIILSFFCMPVAWGCLYDSAFRASCGSCWVILLILTIVYYVSYFYSIGNNEDPASAEANVLIWVLQVLGWVLLFSRCIIRGKIRQKYQIPGNACTDCCCTTCFGCCTAIQAYDQLASSHENPQILPAQYHDASLIV